MPECPICHLMMDTLDTQCPRCHGDLKYKARQARLSAAREDQRTFKRIVVWASVSLVLLGSILLASTLSTKRQLKEANIESSKRAAVFAAQIKAERKAKEEAQNITHGQKIQAQEPQQQEYQQPQPQYQQPQPQPYWQPCPSCGGKGMWRKPCPQCNGTGIFGECKRCGGKGFQTSYGQSMDDKKIHFCVLCNGKGVERCVYCSVEDHTVICKCYDCMAQGYILAY
jgi:hypothetical protein